MEEQDANRWAERLSCPSMGGRGEATRALAELGAAAIPIAEAILFGKTRWGHPHDAQSRRGALIALRFLGPGAAPAVRQLVLVLAAADADDTLRGEAAAALGAIGEAAREALPALKQASNTPHVDLRMEATAAIKRIEAAIGRTDPVV